MKKKLNDVYVSVDIETSGPIPGPHFMMSIGAAKFDYTGRLMETFYRKLKPLLGSVYHKDTKEFWENNPEAWKEATKNAEDPAIVMKDFVSWSNREGERAVFVAYPAGFDFTFVYWYMIYFVGWSPYSFSALDIKSYMAGKIGKPYRYCVKRNMPKKWIPTRKHTHIAIDDAIEQGELYFNMVKDNETSRT